MSDGIDHVAFSRRPLEWGRLTWLRDWAARQLAGPMAAPAGQPRFACAIVKLDHVGDFVLATGAIHRALTHFGEKNCVLVVSPQAAAFAAHEFPQTLCVTLPSDAERLWREFAPQRAAWRRQLAALSCEHAICLRHQRSIYRDFVLRALPAKRRWWLVDAPFGDRPVLELPAESGRYPREAIAPMELAAHAQLLSSVTETVITPTEILPRLSAPSVNAEPAVVIAPLAKHALRDIPAALVWSALASDARFAEAPIVLLGAADQQERLANYRAAAPSAWQSRIEVQAGGTLEDWLARVAGASLVVAAESATAHIATALDRPLVAVLGGGHPNLLAPWLRSTQQRWLRNQTACYGCDWQCPFPAPICITGVSVAELRQAIGEIYLHSQ